MSYADCIMKKVLGCMSVSRIYFLERLMDDVFVLHVTLLSHQSLKAPCTTKFYFIESEIKDFK